MRKPVKLNLAAISKRLNNRYVCGAISYGQLDWYNDALQWCNHLAAMHNIHPMTVCSIVAALSPMNRWQSNKAATIRFIETMHYGVKHNILCHRYRLQANKASLIYACNPDIDTICNILHGDKTISFFLNIYCANDNEHVTIDRWMLRAAGLKDSCTAAQYKLLSGIIRRNAARYNTAPRQYQAVIRCVERGNAL